MLIFKKGMAVFGFVAAVSSGVYAGAAEDASAGAFAIERVGAFHIRGVDTAIAGTGIFASFEDIIQFGQVKVTYLLPKTDSPKQPVVLMPGFGLAAEIYLETSDGREGWAINLLRRGHPVYLFEPAHSVRNSLNPEPFNQAQMGEASSAPLLFTWGATHVWRRWGLGPEPGVPFADGRFDTSTYDQIVAAFSAIVVDEIDGEKNIAATLRANVSATIRLLEKVGPAALLVHSAAGVPAFAAARERPDLVQAVINVEPVGCPTEDLAELQDLRVLSVFGDHLEVRPQIKMRQDECQLTVDYRAKKDGVSAMYSLPVMGIKGNSHLMMSEDNSAEIAGLIGDWLNASAKATSTP